MATEQFKEDIQDNEVLKVDVQNATINTQLTGSIPSKYMVSTIINAQSVQAGGNTSEISLGIDGTETEVWLALNCDQQPWGALVRNLFGNQGSKHLYPETWNYATVASNTTTPRMVIHLGNSIENPTNLKDAIAVALLVPIDTKVSIYNQSANIATITVRVIRVWRSR